MISEKALKEFKEIYKKHTGQDLDDQRALEVATKLLRAVDLIYRPVSKEQMEEVIKNEKNLNS